MQERIQINLDEMEENQKYLFGIGVNGAHGELKTKVMIYVVWMN